METRCPECHSCEVIPWDDGYLCCDCGIEFEEAKLNYDVGDIEQ